jgi:hypothetical protein
MTVRRAIAVSHTISVRLTEAQRAAHGLRRFALRGRRLEGARAQCTGAGAREDRIVHLEEMLRAVLVVIAPVRHGVLEAPGERVAEREQSCRQPREHAVHALRRLYVVGRRAGLLARAPAFEHGAAAHEIGDAEQPCAGRTEQHEPQDDAEHAVVGLHENGFLDGAAALARIGRHFALGQRLRTLRAQQLVRLRQRACVVLDVLVEVARSEREEKHDERECEIRHPSSLPQKNHAMPATGSTGATASNTVMASVCAALAPFMRRMPQSK